MPSFVLNIETTTTQCSVALSADGKVLALAKSNPSNYQHAHLLHTYIDQVLSDHDLSLSALSAVALSSGPGSYTGLRIGAAAAKGLCFGNDIPLLSIPTLDILAREISPSEGYIIATLDARRDEVYYAVYKHDYKVIQKATPHVVTGNSFSEWTEKGPVYFVGTGLDKCEKIMNDTTQCIFPPASSYPSAEHMVVQSQKSFENELFEDLAYFDVDYLKAFQVTPPKKNALGQ